jgi:hypothetical protein
MFKTALGKPKKQRDLNGHLLTPHEKRLSLNAYAGCKYENHHGHLCFPEEPEILGQPEREEKRC